MKTLHQQQYSFTYSSFKVFLALLIVLFIIYFLFYLLKKVNLKKLSPLSAHFEIISRFPIGEKNYLLLVKLFDKTYLLGVSQNSISNLGEIEIPKDFSSKKNNQKSFSELMDKYLKKKK